MLWMTMLMCFSMLTSLMMIFSKHPMSMGMILLIQVINTALITGLLTNNFWFSYILFMIMIGGMLVLFIYMTSIASNEKFKFSKIILLSFISIMTLIMLYTLISDSLMSEYKELFNYQILNLNLNKYINYPYNIITIMMILYLLMTLIVVVKISKIKYGPLRQMN
uniref:NADH-ubiquinone oxidoreductase chain 6 n=1 Tax=Hydrophilidae sp. BMNH 1274334 TaxID=1796514 RepID=A0A126TFG2_9COLE|nr:NADH dehydrogenase subunit 6 [Hydrophilidae sp. BMNH 1274334]